MDRVIDACLSDSSVLYINDDSCHCLNIYRILWRSWKYQKHIKNLPKPILGQILIIYYITKENLGQSEKKKHRTNIWSSLSNLVAWQWLVYHCRHCSACKRSLLLHSTNALSEALPCLWRKHWDKASHHDSEILTQQWSFKTRLNCVAWRSEDSRCAPDQFCKWAVTSVFSWHCGHVYNPEEMFRSILKKQINSA